MKLNSKAQSIIDSVAYITIATVDENGNPWNTPVAAFHFDGDSTLYWASWTDAMHSQNIRTNGKVFIVIFDSTPLTQEASMGVYIQAKARELTEESEVNQAALVFKGDTYNPADGKAYLGKSPRRIYQAVVLHAWTNGESSMNGEYIDVREDAEL